MQKNDSLDRRDFLKTASLAGAGLWASGALPAPAFARTRSANERVRVAVMGLHGRGGAHLESYAKDPNAEIAYVVDVDSQVLARGLSDAERLQGQRHRGAEDFRRVLEDPNVDALSIAAPDHWHVPAAVLALKAGKHVYVEKPLSFDPAEGELLVRAQEKYGKVMQMGNQQRSDPPSIEVIQAIHEGLIGRPYYARTWYANHRGPIGHGKRTAVPTSLNYDLWQGPAPRVPYFDNRIPYNWHWFYHWGTGEIANNGTHELDIARWALGLDYPTRATSSGGRYAFDDDWEFTDTQDASFDFGGKATIIWTGRSCNGFPVEGRGRGTSIHGTGGTVVMDRNGYEVYDEDNKLVKKRAGEEQVNGLDTRGGDRMTDRHIANFIDGVRTGAKLHSPISEGFKSTMLTHLGNIAQRTGRALKVDPSNGHLLDAEAMRYWDREYQPGWEPTL
jgi:predicted dehydrogenase